MANRGAKAGSVQWTRARYRQLLTRSIGGFAATNKFAGMGAPGRPRRVGAAEHRHNAPSGAHEVARFD